MKASYWVLLFGLFAGLNSCRWGVKDKKTPAITKDTLGYIYQTIKQESKDCGSKPDAGCAAVQIKYPFFKGEQKLDDFIVKKLITSFRIEDVDTSTMDLNVYSQSFINGYERAKKKYHAIAHYKLNSYAKVVRQDSSLTTIEIDGLDIQDGFRQNAITCFINWNTKTNSDLRLNELFINGYEEKLRQIAEPIFRKNEKLGSTTSLKQDYFFKDAKFALNNNFLITPLGLRFLYNDYEIKPFYAGQTELFIPYAQIKSLLRPNTVITQYIK